MLLKHGVNLNAGTNTAVLGLLDERVKLARNYYKNKQRLQCDRGASEGSVSHFRRSLADFQTSLRFCGTHGCSCHSALRNAVITDRKFWPSKVKSELRPLLAKYLP
jgi:hypothetical protein